MVLVKTLEASEKDMNPASIIREVQRWQTALVINVMITKKTREMSIVKGKRYSNCVPTVKNTRRQDHEYI